MVALAAAACHPDDIIPENDVAYLKSIIASEESVVIEEGGKAELYITVKDNGYDLLSRPIALVRTNGIPSANVSLAGISKDASTYGRYLVQLADMDSDLSYEERLQLAVTLEGGSTILSARRSSGATSRTSS